MSVQVIFSFAHQPVTGYVFQTLNEDVTSGTLHDVLADSLPSITQQVEQNLAEFTCGDFAMKARNDDGWWDTTAFTDDSVNPYNRYPYCHYINVYRGGVLVWQGDVDYKTLTFDRKAKTVAFTCLNPLNRLTQWSAELVRRAIPSFFDAGTTSEVGAGYMRDYSKTWYIGQVLNAVLIDSIGNAFPITGLYGMGTGLGRNGVAVGPGFLAPYYLSGGVTTPAAGAYRIIPLAAQTRVAPAPSSATGGQFFQVTTGSDGTGRYVDDPNAAGTAAFPVNGFVGMYLFDDAGQVYLVLSNTSRRIYVQVKSGQPNPTITSTATVPSYYSVRRSNYPNLLETLPDFATVGIQAGDQLTMVTTGSPISAANSSGFTARTKAQTNQYTIQSVGPNTSPPLTSNQAWLTESVKYDVDIANDGVFLTTPYYRNSAVLSVVAALFASICGGIYSVSGGTVQVNEAEFLDAYGAPKTLPYADFGGKSVSDALTELAVVMNCTLSCGFSGGTSNPTVKFYFQRRDIQPTDPGFTTLWNLSGNDASGLPKIGTWENGKQWEQWFPQVTVTGANGVEAASGSLRYGGSSLSIQSDYMTTFDWVSQVRDRLWAFFGSRHATAKVQARAEYVSGIGLLSRVSLTGADEWFVYAISDPVREPQDFIELTLVSKQTWSFTPPDYLATTGPTDLGGSSSAPPPDPPKILSIIWVANPGGGYFRKVKMSWPFSIGTLIGLQCTIWSGSAARPDTPTMFVGRGGALSILLRINPDGTLEHWINDNVVAPLTSPYVVDYMAVLYDGEMSVPCQPWEMHEDTQSAGPLNGTVTSPPITVNPGIDKGGPLNPGY